MRPPSKDRDDRWEILKKKTLGEINFSGNVAVIDCVTLWLTNFFVDTENDVELSLELAKQNLTRSQIKKMQQL
jgi:adenosylcobinamide kinase/adenosylcobinamide-phosphate guanylyltransferase